MHRVVKLAVYQKCSHIAKCPLTRNCNIPESVQDPLEVSDSFIKYSWNQGQNKGGLRLLPHVPPGQLGALWTESTAAGPARLLPLGPLRFPSRKSSRELGPFVHNCWGLHTVHTVSAGGVRGPHAHHS